MRSKKPLLYAAGVLLLVLLVKYSDSVFGFLSVLLSVIMPVLMGCAIAYVLNILVSRIERLPFLGRESSPLYRRRRLLSILLALVLILAAAAVVVRIIIPQMAEAFGVILGGIPPLIERLIQWLSTREFQFPQVEEWLESLNLNWPQLIQKAASYLSTGLTTIFSSTFTILTSIGGAVVQLVLAFIFALYLLGGKERLQRQFRSLADVYLPERARQRLYRLLSTANDTFSRFIVGQFTEAIIIGVLCALGMMLLRFPYAAMIGTLVGVTALLPVVGAYLGAGIGAFMVMTVNPLQAIGFLIFIVVLQQLEGNLIYPRVVGSSIGLPGFWVLAAVTIGGGLGGILGILLAVPTTATIYRLLKTDVAAKKALRLEDKEAPDDPA